MKTVFSIIAVFFISISSAKAGNCQSQCVDSLAKDTSVVNQLKTFSQPFRDSLPKPAGWINDYESLFTDRQEQELSSLIHDFEKKTTIEIAIVTIDTKMTTKEQFDNLVLRIHDTWGVGKKDKNNGIVIGVSANNRSIRISNGDGIKKMLSDSETKSIIDKYFIPYFKQGDYFEGTRHGLNALIAKLNEKMRQKDK